MKDFTDTKSKEKEVAELQELQMKPSINASSRLIALNMGTASDRLLGTKNELEETARDRAELKAGLKEPTPVISFE
jgi:hypothetical protein